MTLLFIYGTLKRGCSNHGELLGSFVGPARTRPGWTLYLLDGYPGMVRSAGDREGVRGELWLVGDAALAHLDAFEGIAEGLYTREPVELAEPPLAQGVHTYVYAHPVEGRAEIGGEWEE